MLGLALHGTDLVQKLRARTTMTVKKESSDKHSPPTKTNMSASTATHGAGAHGSASGSGSDGAVGPATPSSSAAAAAAAAAAAGGSVHDLLTPEEKKQNHILSEKKRRESIRNGFVTLTELVPGLTPARSKSEALVLRATVDYLDQLHEEREALDRDIAALERSAAAGGPGHGQGQGPGAMTLPGLPVGMPRGPNVYTAKGNGRSGPP